MKLADATRFPRPCGAQERLKQFLRAHADEVYYYSDLRRALPVSRSAVDAFRVSHPEWTCDHQGMHWYGHPDIIATFRQQLSNETENRRNAGPAPAGRGKPVPPGAAQGRARPAVGR